MKPLTIAISMRWKNKVFHHRKHLRITLLVPMRWSEWSTPFIYLLYLSMALGWSTITLVHTLSVLVFLSVGTLSLALSRVVSTDTTLLSIHYKQRQGGTLSQRILPLSCFFAHCYPFFMLTGNCRGSPILSQLPAHRHQINLWKEQLMNKNYQNTNDSPGGKK